MLESILSLDKSLFLYLNSFHHPMLDWLMIFISSSIIPVLSLSLLFIVCGFLKFKRNVIFLFIILFSSFVLADALSTHVFKKSVERLRPCHDKGIQKVYTANHGCGGKRSFLSAHAANWFSAVTLTWLILKGFSKLFILGFPFAAMVSYSRIYLGRHYPLDIICGAILGIMIAVLTYKLIKNKTTLLKC